VLSLDIPHYRTSEPSAYFQDEWNVTPSLIVSWGVRYDLYTPVTEIENRLSNFDTKLGEIVVAGKDGVSKTANVNTDYSGFVPRVGFNYALRANLTLHGGFGMVTTVPSSGIDTNNTPYVYSYGTCSSTTCDSAYATFADGLPEPTTPDVTNPSGTMQNTRADNFKNMYMEQFNFGVDYTISAHDVAHITYVGSLGRHLTRQFPDLNAPTPNASSTPDTLRPYYSKYPNLTTIGYNDAGGKSSYNALQASFSHAIDHGLMANMNYTYAHGLDNVRPWLFDQTGFGTVLSDSSTRDYGNSDFDVRHHIVATVSYDLPFGANAHGFKKYLEKGWQFNVMEVWGTGLPFTVLNATNVSGTNPGAAKTDRPDVSGKVALSNPGIGRFFNTDAFTAQTTGTLGSERRNLYFGPHSRHTDVSLFKNFTVYGVAAQFRTEAFNVTNTANFSTPANALNGANFGELTNTTQGYTPREIQFALRLQF
jgi:hypothetical protein